MCLWSTVCKILTALFSSQNDFEGVWWLRFATMSSCALVFTSGKNSTWSGRAQANGWRTKIRQDYQVESFRNCNPKHFFLSLLLFISKFLFLVAFCWAWWYGLEGIHGHFEVHYQGFWRAWSLVSQGLDGWTKSQWIFALATFGYSSQLRHVLPGKHSYLQIPQLNCWWPLWYLCRIRFFFRVWMKSQ